MYRLSTHIFFALFLLSITLIGTHAKSYAQSAPTDQLSSIHGMLLNPKPDASSPADLLIATKYGLLKANPNGMAVLMPEPKAGVVSLVAHPGDPQKIFASGYGVEGKIFAVMMSSNGGDRWKHISDGTTAQAFHAMDISLSNPETIYGANKELHVSQDGGLSWNTVGKLPGELIDFAVSPKDSNTVYAATKEGLFISHDGGSNWKQDDQIHGPTTLIHAAPKGQLFTFIYGVGFLTKSTTAMAWESLSDGFADRYLRHLVIDPNKPERLYATADTGAILISSDGGRSWSSFEGSQTASPANIAKGKQVFEEICAACHGEKGIGEAPGDPSAKDEHGFKAPALNDDAHAWHHSDQNLKQTIQKGSSRNERMVAYKDILPGEDISNVIAYIKSLWNIRSLACQGARHMSCMGG
jgi:photosystem II stability/assembly factor-like uncharacterized protein